MGFKSAIDQSLQNDEVRFALHDIIHTLKTDNLKKELYGKIPHYKLDKENTILPCGDVYGNSVVEKLSGSYPFSITQFSDSYVLSCPIENLASCRLMLKCIYLIHLMYYYNLGMMMRGGVTIGKLIHEEGGALFGPAMNSAYAIESKISIYPRVVVSKEAALFLKEKVPSAPELEPFKTSFDGHTVFDLISIFSWPEGKDEPQEEVDKRLKVIEQDVLNNSPFAHPKIAYLISEWEKSKKT
jgi:hypothetical protein